MAVKREEQYFYTLTAIYKFKRIKIIKPGKLCF